MIAAQRGCGATEGQVAPASFQLSPYVTSVHLLRRRALEDFGFVPW